MRPRSRGERLITGTNIREFFRDSITAAMTNQSIDADEHTVHYVVNLLSAFSRSDRLYEQTAHGPALKPLALMYADAVHARSAREREAALQRLGDVSLFMAGFFANALARKLVDLDYYIAMGGNAYSSLSDGCPATRRSRALAQIFQELAEKFTDFVDVLAEISEAGKLSSDRDILRLYEIWLRTGSKRAARTLRRLGIHPLPGLARSYH